MVVLVVSDDAEEVAADEVSLLPVVSSLGVHETAAKRTANDKNNEKILFAQLADTGLNIMSPLFSLTKYNINKNPGVFPGP